MQWDDRILGREETYWHGRLASKEYLQISEVHSGSIAEAAGLRPGLLTMLVEDGAVVTDWDMLKMRGADGPVTTTYFDKQGLAYISLRTQGFPWGMRLHMPHDQFCTNVREGFPEIDELATRVLCAGDTDYRELIAAARYAVDRPGLVKRGVQLFVKFRTRKMPGRNALEQRDDILRTAASLDAAAKGDAAAADRLLPDASDHLLHGYGTAVAALYLYASAMHAAAHGAPAQEIIDRLLAANEQMPKAARIVQALTDRQVAAPANASWLLRPFPTDYHLPAVDPLKELPGPDSRYVRLREELAKLRPDQIGVVISMASYRTNGPYHWLVSNFGHLYPALAPRIGIVHMLTSVLEPNRDFVMAWHAGEAYAVQRGVPLTVLTDAEDVVSDALRQRKCPQMYLLDRQGRILYEGSDQDDGPFWQALSEIDAQLGRA